MTVQTLKIGKREFVLLPKRDFEKLAEQARRQIEDEYWTDSALRTEARARARREKPVPLEQVEREIDERRLSGSKRGRRSAR